MNFMVHTEAFVMVRSEYLFQRKGAAFLLKFPHIHTALINHTKIYWNGQ